MDIGLKDISTRKNKIRCFMHTGNMAHIGSRFLEYAQTETSGNGRRCAIFIRQGVKYI